MVSKISFLLCLSVAFAAQYPAHTGYGGYQGGYSGGFAKNVVPIVSQDFQIAPDGRSYQFSYVSGDGSQRQETGSQKGPDTYSVSGSFSYTLPNGAPVQVHYVSDEFGYQPSGAGVHPDIVKAVAEQVAEARSSPGGGYGGSYGGSYQSHSGSSFGGYRPVYG